MAPLGKISPALYVTHATVQDGYTAVVDAGSLSTIWVIVMIWPMRCVDILTLLWWLYLIDWKMRYVGHLVALGVRQARPGISGHGQLSEFAGAMLWKWTTIDTVPMYAFDATWSQARHHTHRATRASLSFAGQRHYVFHCNVRRVTKRRRFGLELY